MKTGERLFAGFPACSPAIFALLKGSVVVYDARDGNIPLLRLNAALMKAYYKFFGSCRLIPAAG